MIKFAMSCALIISIGFLAMSARGDAVPTPDPKPPANAVVLFDGKDTSPFQMRKDGGPCAWKVMDDGCMESAVGDIVSKQKFQDFNAHVEFWVPNMPPEKKGQARGNSGVYLQGRYEIQVLDSYGLQPQKNDCGAIYNQKAPDVNACKPPEQWQTYDITYRAARYDNSGKKIQNARVSVIQNGQQIQKDVEILGPTGSGDPEGPEPGPLMLQFHGNKVRFRNVWVVPTGGGNGGSDNTNNKDAK
jgi:hypothetical protein